MKIWPFKFDIKWSTFLLLMCLGVIIFFVGIHLVINSAKFQHWALEQVNKTGPFKIETDKITFLGATGFFSGDHINIEFPKSNASITLNKFQIAFSPLRLFLGKLHLSELTAEGLTLTLSEFPQSEKNSKKEARNLEPILDFFHIEKGVITNIHIRAPHQTQLNISKLLLKSKKPFLFYKQALDVEAHEIDLRTPKIDLIMDTLHAAGSFNLKYIPSKKENEPRIDGTIEFSKTLLAFAKKPTPWNPEPGWDDSLTPILEKIYPLGISETKEYVYAQNIRLPLYFQPELIRLKNGKIKAFEGELSLNGFWDRRSKKMRYEVSSPNPISMPLLPLGKSNLRSAFKKIDLQLEGQGFLTSLEKGNIDSKANIKFTGNNYVPENGPINLHVEHKFKDGKLNINALDLALKDGILEGNGNIDFIKKKYNLNVSGKNIDVHTSVRLFAKIDLPGTADLSGNIKGDLNNPHFSIKLNSPLFYYEGLKVGTFDGSLIIQDKKLVLKGTTSLAGQGNGELDLQIEELFKSANRNVKLKAKIANYPLDNIYETNQLSGNLNAYFNFNKTPWDYIGDGNFKVENATWYSVPIGHIETDVKLIDKNLYLKNTQIKWNDQTPLQTVANGVSFYFYPSGYNFSGNILPTLKIDGEFFEADPLNLTINLTLQKTNLNFLAPLIPVDIKEFSTSADAKLFYRFQKPQETRLEANLKSLNFTGGEDKSISLTRPTTIKFSFKELEFINSSLRFGQGNITLNGVLDFAGNSNLGIKGSMDLAQLTEITPWISEGSGIANTDIKIQGSYDNPLINGKINLNGPSILFRDIAGEFSEIKGSLSFSGSRIGFNDLHLLYDDAPLHLNGSIDYSYASSRIIGANLSISGQELSFNNPDTWRILTDVDVKLIGSGDAIRLAGELNIVEGLFYKDYSIAQFVLKPVGDTGSFSDRIPQFFENLLLDLSIKSTGDFLVQNNLADLVLKTNLRLKGSIQSPQTSGSVNITEGAIHAFGIDFEDATGFASFGRSSGFNPFIEFTASNIIQDYEIKAKLRGYADNLSLNLESTPALNQRDIISLIAFGRTPDQLSDTNQNLFSQKAIASQLVGILQRPISKATKLDIVRLEQAYDRSNREVTPSRFSIGKRLSERFSLSFTTDLTLDETFNGLTAEYLILDNLLLKGSKDAGSRYRFDLTWRFQSY